MISLLHNLRRKDWLFSAVAVVLVLLQVWLDLKVPEQMEQITRLIQSGQATPETVLLPGGSMLLCALGSFLFAAAGSVFVAAAATNFGTSLRKNLFEKVQAFSAADFEAFSTASLITRTTNDVMQVQMLLVMGLQSMIKAPVMVVWAAMKIVDKSAAWTISVAAAIGLLLLLVGTCFALSLPYYQKLQSMTDTLNGVTRDHLSGIQVVRAYNAQGHMEKKFETANRKLTDAHLFTGQVMAVMTPGIQAIMSGLNLAIYLIGAVLIDRAAAMERIGLFSDMVVFSQYSIQIVMAFMMLIMSLTALPRAAVSAGRILEVLDKDTRQEPAETADPIPAVGSITFRDVSFRYPEGREDVLKNVSFEILPGETVAIVGPTGAGKTTLLNLIPRLQDASAGQVLVDGVDVKQFSGAELRDRIGYATQKAVLFSGSVRENILFGNRQAGPDISEALEIAQAGAFVQASPEGTGAKVAQFGKNYSGGEKQRLAIARTIARNARILIFDDAFSALDYRTECSLRRALAEAFPDTTKLIVTQRIATIMDVPRIIVLNEGEIVGIGSHGELMERCGVYRTIASLQLDQEVE